MAGMAMAGAARVAGCAMVAGLGLVVQEKAAPTWLDIVSCDLRGQHNLGRSPFHSRINNNHQCWFASSLVPFLVALEDMRDGGCWVLDWIFDS